MFPATYWFVCPGGLPRTLLRKRRSLVITRKEAAEALGVDPRTITTSINEGTIPHVKLGRRIVIPREKFLAPFADTSPEHDGS